MVKDVSPFNIPDSAYETLFHRAAAAWGSGETFSIQDGIGGWADLTKLYEQYRIIKALKENYVQEESPPWGG